jgi:hypothetical protein
MLLAHLKYFRTGLFGIPWSIEHGVSLIELPHFPGTYFSVHIPLHIQRS